MHFAKLSSHAFGMYRDSLFCGLLLTAQGGSALRRFVSDLMRPIVDALMDGASISKREVAVATLGKVVESTG